MRWERWREWCAAMMRGAAPPQMLCPSESVAERCQGLVEAFRYLQSFERRLTEDMDQKSLDRLGKVFGAWLQAADNALHLAEERRENGTEEHLAHFLAMREKAADHLAEIRSARESGRSTSDKEIVGEQPHLPDEDAVDLASEESFPASDPPSWTPVVRSGSPETRD